MADVTDLPPPADPPDDEDVEVAELLDGLLRLLENPRLPELVNAFMARKDTEESRAHIRGMAGIIVRGVLAGGVVVTILFLGANEFIQEVTLATLLGGIVAALFVGRKTSL